MEGRFDLGDDLRRHRGGRRAHEAQAMTGDDLAIVRGARQDRLMHRRHGRVPGRLCLLHPGEETQSIEAWRAKYAAASRERRQQPRHEPVNVKQRHDLEAAILRREGKRLCDVVCRRADILLRQRYDLGSRRRARRMQDESDGRGIGLTRRSRGTRGCCAIETERAGALLRRRRERDDCHAEIARHREGGRRAARFDDQRLRTEVRHVEMEFVGAIGWIERRCRGTRRDR